jgi:hypothetical protein
MIVSLTSDEVLHVLQTIVKNPLQEPDAQATLVEKIKKPILSALEKVEEKQYVDAFEAWSAREQQKIEELSQKNSSLKPAKMAAAKVVKKR